MPYPMAPMPTLGDFVQRAVHDYQARLVTAKDAPVGPRGPTQIRYLVRGTNFAVLPEFGDTTVLTPDVLRSLCVQLGIDQADFGLHLG